MLEIYTIYGGGMWKTALDAVVTLVGQNTFHTLMRIAGTFGVLAVLLTFIKQRNPMVFVQWLVIFNDPDDHPAGTETFSTDN
jgi:conjugal transfer mating pair stabilization protein TraG